MREGSLEAPTRHPLDWKNDDFWNVDKLNHELGLLGARGLVLANGGFLSKEAAGVYSTEPMPGWQPLSDADIQAQCDTQVGPRLLSEDADGTLESFTVTYVKGEAARGYAFLRTDDGARLLARVAKSFSALE